LQASFAQEDYSTLFRTDFRSPFGVAALALAIPFATHAQTAANAFFDDSTVQIVNVAMDPNDWAALLQNYTLDTYYHATMTWNGQTVGFGIRSHGGNGSRSPIKPNLDFNFAHYTTGQTFLGLPFVVMKANNEDASNLHEWISMKLYRKMGLPAPREAPAQLFINGQLLGFYYIIEHEDESFLERNFGEDGGYLYEWEYDGSACCNYEWGNLGTSPNSYSTMVELKTDQATPDLTNLANLIQAINASTASESTYISGLSAYMDPKLFLSYCATENLLAEEDGVLDGVVGLNNFYLYQFQNQTLYQMIAWDKDRAFSSPTRGLLDGITSGATVDILAQNLYTFPDYQKYYLSEATRAATLFGGAGGWADSEITREWGVISAAALNDPNKQCNPAGAGPVPCGAEATEAGVEAVYAFIGQRSAFILSSALSAGYQPITTSPQIQSLELASTSSPTQLVSPGALADVLGANLGPATQSNAPPASSGPLPRILNGAFVAVEGVRAPLMSTQSGQIEFQIPGDQATGMASVVVYAGSAMSNSFAVDTWTTTPVLLATTRANGTVIAPGNAPVAGEAVSIYALGLGWVTPDVPLGGATTANALSSTILTPQLQLGSSTMNVLFSGLVPGYVGLYLVNALMPSTLPQGATGTLTFTDDGQVVTSQIALQ
jgi:uncharacterized protein (TIGR03437 family)